MKVLIVDDEQDLLDSLQEFFQDRGFAVSTAVDGAEALHILHHEVLPCVVILDLSMPVVSGNEVYAEMQTDPRLAGVPVVISTSDPSRAPSGTHIIRKPLDLSRLLGAVRQYCVE